MNIEFEARWVRPKKLTDEEKAVRDTTRIIKGEVDQESLDDEFEYVYNPLTVDLYNIKAYNQLDDDHTTIRDFDGDVYVIKTKYRTFKYLKEFLTGNMVRPVDHFMVEEQLIQKADKISQIMDAYAEAHPDEDISDL